MVTGADMKVKVTKGTDGSLDSIFAKYLALEEMQVEAGFITHKKHPETGIDMVELATIQQFGSVTKNIPERPFMTDGFVLSQNEMKKELPNAIHRYLKGTSLNVALKPIAEISKESIVNAIKMQRFTPLSPTTIKKRREKGNNSTTILIDTSYMINNVETKISKK